MLVGVKKSCPSLTPIGGLDYLDFWTALEKIQIMRFRLFRPPLHGLLIIGF